MFGSEYSSQPQILLSSFGEMHRKYKKLTKKNRKSSIIFLYQVYIKMFGIPEIGFQTRSMYFTNIVNEKIGKKKLKKILDAGSGIGTYSVRLAKKYPQAMVVGGEIDGDKIKFSEFFADKNKIKNVEFKKFDVTKNNGKKGQYDLIVNIDVLEHIEDYKQVLKNFYNQLGSGGYLFIHTPQLNQKRIFKSLKNWAHEDHVHEGYIPEDLKKELNKLGFRVIVLRETFGFFGKLSWELNHIFLKKNFVLAGLTFPFLYLISKLDMVTNNKQGLGMAILARKK